jgi:hypothetical protein
MRYRTLNLLLMTVMFDVPVTSDMVDAYTMSVTSDASGIFDKIISGWHAPTTRQMV